MPIQVEYAEDPGGHTDVTGTSPLQDHELCVATCTVVLRTKSHMYRSWSGPSDKRGDSAYTSARTQFDLAFNRGDVNE